jgi:transposase
MQEHGMTDKQVRGRYTLEFKIEAVRQVKAGRSVGEVARVLGMPKASLSNWVRQDAKEGLTAGAGTTKAATVSPEQMELARLRAEVARLRMERDIAKKAAAYFAQDTLRGTPGSTK